jgi:hypothetical protein
VGSIRLDGVRFVAYPEDHAPCHVHGFYAETEVVMELRELPEKEVARANRTDAVRPGNASRNNVRHILEVAATNFDKLVELWEKAHV